MTIPTRRELAVEIAERNDRCGKEDLVGLCLKAKSHGGECQFEPFRKVVPIT